VVYGNSLKNPIDIVKNAKKLGLVPWTVEGVLENNGGTAMKQLINFYFALQISKGLLPLNTAGILQHDRTWRSFGSMISLLA
jgi:hypothetical protein